MYTTAVSLSCCIAMRSIPGLINWPTTAASSSIDGKEAIPEAFRGLFAKRSVFRFCSPVP